MRLVSRYWSSDFWILSSFTSMPVARSSMPGCLHWRIAFGSAAIAAMIDLNVSFTCPNRIDSSGSCLQMSSDAMKIDSRYIHLRCTVSSISTTSETSESPPSQKSIFVLKLA